MAWMVLGHQPLGESLQLLCRRQPEAGCGLAFPSGLVVVCDPTGLPSAHTVGHLIG